MKPAIPQNLNCPEFQAVWAEWHKHRTEIGHKLRPTCEGKQLKKLAKYPVKAAIAALETSMLYGYAGFWVKGKERPTDKQLDQQKVQDQAAERRKQDKQRRDYGAYIAEILRNEGEKGLEAWAANHHWLLWLCKEIKEQAETGE